MNDDVVDDFAPRWAGCAGIFNEGDGLDSRQNEEVHYRKHAVIGKEWGPALSLSDYRAKATQHLDDLDRDGVVELCQADDLAVVKFNLRTGDLGIARRDDGTIKTFFRPGDVHYVLRKVQAGLWGSPEIVNGYDIGVAVEAFVDPELRYLVERLEALSLEVAAQCHEIVQDFLRAEPSAVGILSLLARLAECRFLVFEIRRRVLTAEQEDIVFALRKRIAVANASLEGLERHRGSELVSVVQDGLEAAVRDQDQLWRNAPDLIADREMFESALDERQAIAFIVMEVRILQFNGRLRDVRLEACEQQIRRVDIFLRKYFYSLAKRFGYVESHVVVSEDFHWRRMARF